MTKYRILSISIVILGVSLGFIMNNQAAEGETTQTPATKTSNIATAYSVSVVTASKQNVSNKLSLIGTIAANNDVVILSETNGRVIKVNAEIGEYKQAGSILVEVDAELKEANYKTAQLSYDKAKKDLERFESLYKDNSISESQIEQARWSFQAAEAQYIVARRQLKDTKITTPISGIITSRLVDIGSMVMGAPQATVIANVVDISKLKVKINVGEKDVFKLNIGDKVQVTTDVYPSASFEGKIASIAAKGDEAHTYPVEVRMENSKQYPLKAGMFGRVNFTQKNQRSNIIIPREAVVGSVKNAKVYVVKNNIVQLRSVSVGSESGTNVEIVSGLSEGEVIVVNGKNNLKDNASVVVRNK
ncbi:MAG: efflux RND transporter periplasmic adaptor subunit [Bacteriovoracaceae bacterium]|nr:efflux RND transporter periplasmic adaptor subunit [Bacteroidota bacterium]